MESQFASSVGSVLLSHGISARWVFQGKLGGPLWILITPLHHGRQDEEEEKEEEKINWWPRNRTASGANRTQVARSVHKHRDPWKDIKRKKHQPNYPFTDISFPATVSSVSSTIRLRCSIAMPTRPERNWTNAFLPDIRKNNNQEAHTRRAVELEWLVLSLEAPHDSEPFSVSVPLLLPHGSSSSYCAAAAW